MDHAGRVPRAPGRARGLDQRRVVHRRDDGARPRDRLRGPAAHGRGAGAHARAGAPGDGGGRARRGLLADLRTRVLREDG